MVIRAENLGQMTIAHIDEKRQLGMKISLDISQQFFEEEQKKRAKIVSKYPDYAFKPIAELTQDERQSIIDTYFDARTFSVKTSGSLIMGKKYVKATLKKIEEERKGPISDAKLLDMRNEMFPKVPTQNPELKRIRNDYEKNIFFAINKSSLLTENFDRLCATIKHYLTCGVFVKILVDEKMRERQNDSISNYIYTNEEKEKINQLNNIINKNGSGEIRFTEYHSVSEDDWSEDIFNNAWTLKDVARANKSIDKIVEYIKLNKFSPFETMVFIHDYITSTFEYKEGSTESCRVVPGAFKNGDIVCSGYASMVKAIIDKLDNKNLSCNIVGCAIYKGKILSHVEGGHAHNMIHIRDEKYDIDGVYMEDACWDSKCKNFAEGRGFAHCLFPVTDLEHFRGATYVPTTSMDRFSNLVVDVNDPYSKKRFIPRSTLPQPWIIEQFGNQSKPIPLKKYEDCLNRVYELKFNGDKTKIEEKIDPSLKSSIHFAKMVFKNGDSCFSTTKRYNIKGKGKFSLEKNDGRAPITEMNID